MEPTNGKTLSPSNSPTLLCGLTETDRELIITAILGLFSDPVLLQDSSTPQGQALDWILNHDGLRLCPGDPKITQRWVLAVMYYSTDGDNWAVCYENDPLCPDSFLNPSNECDWFGITCVTSPNGDECVERIIFEANELSGTIPTELGLLSDLAVLGMEQGTTTGTIPTELGQLEKMVFIDLDYNQLTGSIPTEIYQLTRLQTLDLNVNLLSGRIETSIGRLTSLDFVQLQNNLFTGTIPTEIGALENLQTFNVHRNDFSGEVSDDICALTPIPLQDLIADCQCPGVGAAPEKVSCTCCTGCGC